jgi:hypothetical protein
MGLIDEVSAIGRSRALAHLHDVLCDRIPAQVQYLTDLRVGQALSDQFENGELSRR